MSLKVLLACDDAPMRGRLLDALGEQRDVQVLETVPGGQAAQEQAAQSAADVVVITLSSPEGLKVAQSILEHSPDARVVVVLPPGSGTLIRQAVRSGARGVLLWESAPAECPEAVRVIARGEHYFGGGVLDSVFQSIHDSRADGDALSALTATEREILRLAVNGHSNSQIAVQLHLSPRTIETYRARLMRKLVLKDLPSLVKFAIRHGITPEE